MESAGPGNPWCRAAEGQLFSGTLPALGRRGRNRALVAVAHALVVAIYHMLTRQEPFRDPGCNYFDERKRESVVSWLLHRLEKLGYSVEVALQPVQPEGVT